MFHSREAADIGLKTLQTNKKHFDVLANKVKEAFSDEPFSCGGVTGEVNGEIRFMIAGYEFALVHTLDLVGQESDSWVTRTGVSLVKLLKLRGGDDKQEWKLPAIKLSSSGGLTSPKVNNGKEVPIHELSKETAKSLLIDLLVTGNPVFFAGGTSTKG